MNKDRVTGTMIGHACGDALGTTLEFSGSRPDAGMLTGPHTDITGGGPFRVRVGQGTDDTHMATCIAASLIERQGVFDPVDIGERYRAWKQVTFDCGGTCSGSISMIAQVGAGESGLAHWVHSGKGAAANGSLMRTAIIGAFFAEDASRRRQASMIDSAITHFDPRCQLACAAYNAAIGTAATFEGDESDLTAAMMDAASAELHKAAEVMLQDYEEYRTEIEDAVEFLAFDLRMANQDVAFPLTDSVGLGGGFVRTAFRLAFWELKHAQTFAEGLIDCVNRGGDADTNGAIAGGLLGARFGAAGIPADWIRKVLHACEDMPASHWWTTYHPRVYVELLTLKFGEPPVLPA